MAGQRNVALLAAVALMAFGAVASLAAAPKEQKIVYALGGEAETLDPTKNVYSRSSIVLQNLFRGLYKMGEDGTTEPSMAADVTIDKTGTKYVFKLRDALWSDGKPVTAMDFEYSWKRVLNPETASKAAFYLYYLKNGKAYNDGKAKAEDVGVKALDAKTLEVTLENPTAYFLDLLCVTAYYPVRKDVVEAATPWTKSPSTYISNGPFKLTEIKPKEKYVLKKNPNYVDAAKVKLETLEIVFIEAAEAELAAYMGGSISVSDNMNAESVKMFEKTPEFYSVPRIGVYYFDINTTKKPFDDARVRKAFAIGFNREQVVRNVLQLTERPAYGMIPYGIPYATKPAKNFRDIVPEPFKEDIAAAKKLLADAGYPDGKGLPPVTITVMNNQSNKDAAQAMQAMWKKNLGVEVTIQTWESKVYWDEMSNGNFQIMRDGWTGDYPDPMTNLDIFESSQTDDDNRWVNKEYDRLLAENRKITDQQKRMDNFAKAEKILMDEMPVFPLYYYTDTFIAKPGVKGVTKNFIGHTFFEYASVE